MIHAAKHLTATTRGGFVSNEALAFLLFMSTSPDYLSNLEKLELQRQTGSTTDELTNLRENFYGTQVGSTGTTADKIRRYLATQTGSAAVALNDLWRTFMVQQGVVNVTSITDMFIDFYKRIGFNTGGYTGGGSLLLEDGVSFLLLEDGTSKLLLE